MPAQGACSRSPRGRSPRVLCVPHGQGRSTPRTPPLTCLDKALHSCHMAPSCCIVQRGVAATCKYVKWHGNDGNSSKFGAGHVPNVDRPVGQWRSVWTGTPESISASPRLLYISKARTAKCVVALASRYVECPGRCVGRCALVSCLCQPRAESCAEHTLAATYTQTAY